MPIITSPYRAKGLFKNGHFSTIYSAKLRTTPSITQKRERISMKDGDFLDLDFSHSEEKQGRLVILLHGLEGNAQRTYIRGQAKLLTQNGWDVCAVNYRGCSGETNLKYESYNAGKTEDLEQVIHHLLEKDMYDHIALVGFSLGGNLLLKYLGERNNVPAEIKSAVAISSPLHLKGSLERLTEFQNWVYRTSFLIDLKGKFKEKLEKFPEQMDTNDLKKIKSLLDFDNIYTAPAHGFKDAFDYYERNSSLQFVPEISIPVLILNAENDTFLSPNCYPREFASGSKNIYLETPIHGGHVGFHKTNTIYYSEERVLQFINSKLSYENP